LINLWSDDSAAVVADDRGHAGSRAMTTPAAASPATTARLVERWPTALALVITAAVAAVILGIDDVDELGGSFAPGAAAMMVLYVATFAIGRPAAVWLVLAVSMAATILLEVVGVEGAISWTVILGLSWLWVLTRGRGSDRPWFTIETMGLLYFGGLTVVAALTNGRVAGVLAGVGWLTHGFWDAYHFARDRVVHRTWSELCTVVDIPVGALLIVVSLVR
jgi:hypothetical protein